VADIARLRRKHPEISQADVATRVAVTERTVRRHWATTTPPTIATNPAPGPTTGLATEVSTDVDEAEAA